MADGEKIYDGENAKIIVKNEGLNPEYSGDNSRFINEFGKFQYTKHQEAVNDLYKWYSSQNIINFNSLGFDL